MLRFNWPFHLGYVVYNTKPTVQPSSMNCLPVTVLVWTFFLHTRLNLVFTFIIVKILWFPYVNPREKISCQFAKCTNLFYSFMWYSLNVSETVPVVDMALHMYELSMLTWHSSLASQKSVKRYTIMKGYETGSTVLFWLIKILFPAIMCMCVVHYKYSHNLASSSNILLLFTTNWWLFLVILLTEYFTSLSLITKKLFMNMCTSTPSSK